ncbi:MAG: hypothetical protein P4L98_09285 [Ancalomicrobiaceae bacterium]|nr:hypothetical protein [Ancalomicrobiaceae bacterium]
MIGKTPLLGSEIQPWNEAEILKICRSSTLRHGYSRWLSLAKRGKTPLLKDLFGSEEEARLDEAMLLLQNGSDFLYVYQGHLSVQKYGKCFRGVSLSTINGNMTNSWLNIYNSTLRDMRPKYVQFRADFSPKHVRWERIILPVVSDGEEPVKFVMTYSEPLDDKLDVLSATFDRSPIGMIAAARAVGENRSLDEAEILLINARARSILNLSESGLAVRTVADLRSWIKDVVGWEQVSKPNNDPGRATLQFRSANDERKISVIVEPYEYFVVYHFLEM